MVKLLIGYVASAAAMAVLDVAWLMLVMKSLFEASVGQLMAERTSYMPVVLFYGIYVAGIVFFAVLPALRQASLVVALMSGAALGFVAYCTYDLTNMATLKVWPLHTALIDIAWGCVVSGLAAAAGYLAASRTW